jgi:hypothetical protein
MKRGIQATFLLSLVLLSVMQVNLITGQAPQETAEQLGNNANIFGNGIIKFFQAALGLNDASGFGLIVYLFMGIIILLLVYSTMDTMDLFGKKNYLDWLISIAVTGLVLLALPKDFYSLILPSYGALGGALLTILPFLVIFFFSVRVKSIAFAQMIWALFGIYFMGFYAMSAISLWNADSYGYSIIYGITGLLGFAMMFIIPYVRSIFTTGGTDEIVKDIENATTIRKAIQESELSQGKGYTVSESMIN